MKFSLIICTYMRPCAIVQLLQSVQTQSLYPDEILIIDGSLNLETEKVLQDNPMANLQYFAVPPEHRGLTKQRNFGIEKISTNTELVCFLDDDTILSVTYFEELIKTFKEDPEISGVGGLAVNENKWAVCDPQSKYNTYHFFIFEGYVYKEGLRNVVRNYLGLQSNLGPNRMPNFSHGRTCGFPLNGKIYEVDLMMGMSFAFRKKVCDVMRFSAYFEGYGLYEDADYCLRALQYGKNVINTKVQLEHFHAPSGRPNQYKYGKMVVRNGWYVWRVKNPKPLLRDQLKWHAITLLLIKIRFINAFTTRKRRDSFSEAVGRTVGWWSLWVNKPKIKN